MPFISQPSTMIVSPAPAETSFLPSSPKWWSRSPRAPSASRWATSWSGILDSFGATIGTFSARTRSGSALLQRVQGPSTNSAPSIDFHVSPGR
ncbi:hypothetical protein [Nonomuraea longispora]|uniref:hypothetical protein n=1 Tax=Nonomuraea longispora TaxID=1848320 RepID=UPI001C700BB5|nr:hypothetical protein [Nonomuraea longispora]